MPKNSSKIIMKSSFPHPAKTIIEYDLHTKMLFLRKYFAAIFGEFLLLSVICSLIMLSPVARFYVTENEWLLYLLCFLYITTYASLLYYAKLPVIDRILAAHIIVQAGAVSIFVTYNDLMYFYMAIVISTCCICALFFYTLQSKLNFNVWVVILLNSMFIYFSFIFLKAFFGGTLFENVISASISVIILCYESYAIFKIMHTLTPNDCIYALINVHTLPMNAVVFSSLILKPS